jgi:hypothetical protein
MTLKMIAKTHLTAFENSSTMTVRNIDDFMYLYYALFYAEIVQLIKSSDREILKDIAGGKPFVIDRSITIREPIIQTEPQFFNCIHALSENRSIYLKYLFENLSRDFDCQIDYVMYERREEDVENTHFRIVLMNKKEISSAHATFRS